MLLQPGTKLVMIGDSITDCGRKRPIGEGLFDALGHGYVSVVHALLASAYPDYRIRVVNMGVGGNTVRDLQERWQSDVLELEPEWVSVMIGINDVWRQFDQPLIRESHVTIKEYEETLRELVERTLPHVKGLILLSPFYIESNHQDAMRSMMDEYGDVVRRVAEDNRCLFVDTQAAFDSALKHVYPASIALDRVHPSLTGHMMIARALLRTLEFDDDRSI